MLSYCLIGGTSARTRNCSTNVRLSVAARFAMTARAGTAPSCATTARSIGDRGPYRGGPRPSTAAGWARSAATADPRWVANPFQERRPPLCSRQRIAIRSADHPPRTPLAPAHLGQRGDGVVGIGQGAHQFTDAASIRISKAPAGRRRGRGNSGKRSSATHRPRRRLPPSGSGRCPGARCNGPRRPGAACGPPRRRGSRGHRPTAARLHVVDVTGYVVPRNI